MKKLDLYIIKNFLITFFYMLGVIMLIAIIFDISEKIDDFVANDAPLKLILTDYYVNFVIFYSSLFSFLLIFLSVVFFTSKMAANTEIIAILSSGISFNRMLVPYFIAATILTGGSLLVNHSILPKANMKRLAFEDQYIRNPFRFAQRKTHKQINPGEFVFIDSYNNISGIGYNFSIEKWDNLELKSKLYAKIIRWDSVKNKWSLTDYYKRTLNGQEESIIKGAQLDTVINLHPSEFSRRVSSITTMSTSELDKFIEEEKLKGSNLIPLYEIERHQRNSNPFATYILTLIGVSIASRKTRGGTGLHIAIGLAVAVTYILAMKVTTVFATNAGLAPVIAVWTPNMLFGLVALVIYFRSAK